MRPSFWGTMCCVILIPVPLALRAQSIAPPTAPPVPASGQTATLTLADASARALRNQPRLQAAQLRAQAAGKTVSASQAGYFPQAFGNVTAVNANEDSAVSAGALTTSSISTRAALGAGLVQMITDFGHTPNLVRSARYQAQASGQ